MERKSAHHDPTRIEASIRDLFNKPPFTYEPTDIEGNPLDKDYLKLIIYMATAGVKKELGGSNRLLNTPSLRESLVIRQKRDESEIKGRRVSKIIENLEFGKFYSTERLADPASKHPLAY